MSGLADLLLEHLDIWTTAIERKKTVGRGKAGRSGKISLYGIDKLRTLILDLAVRGKLVPQDEADEPASELLKRIREEKAKLIAEKKIKKPKRLPPIEDEEKPFDLPQGWEWVRLGDSCTLENGDRGKNYPNKSVLVENGIPFVNAGNLQNDRIDIDQMTFITQNRFDILNGGKFTNSDILFCLRGSLGKTALVTDISEGAIASSLVIVRAIKPFYIQYQEIYFSTPLSYSMISLYDNGTAQPNLSSGDLSKFLIPLPPLAEQKRIVARVGELMALVEALEAGQEEAIAAHHLLVKTLLATLTDSKDAADLATNWTRLETHFDTLFTTEASIGQLKQTILQLAVTGKLLHRATSENEVQLLGKFRKLQNGYAFKSEWYVDDGIRLLRNANIGHGESEWEDVKYLSEDMAVDFERFQLDEGDIVLTMDRPFISTGTKVARITNADLPALLLQRVGRFQESPSGLLNDYLYLWINSRNFNEQIDPGRSNGVPHISSKQVEAAKIFIPTLEEQERIVTKFGELKVLCDQLKLLITDASQTQKHLTDTFVARTTA